ncbi:MAG: deoxyhypusine synthase family protein [Planctomycetota bacterium]|nr:deoxyhypusine synthase family protein [Planctomycetota bacterium]
MGMRDFLKLHYRHFNARETREAAQAWVDHLDAGGKMFLTLAGAMSTAELGISLGRMIREGKVHGICATGANLEEDIFNLVAHDGYEVIPNYRDLTPEHEVELAKRGMNRVTDTCIPESIMRDIDARLLAIWQRAETDGRRGSPWDFMRELVSDEALAEHYKVPREHSWVLAAHDMDIPVWVPGWEDSTLGNVFVGWNILGKLSTHSTVTTGTEQMQSLAAWYDEVSKAGSSIGFFQIGGGIAGDFPICVVPLLIQDTFREDVPFWGYFCQIGDSTTSYGSYSGAVPNEKITWGKLDAHTPKFMINSDASIVAPLIFSYVLDD